MPDPMRRRMRASTAAETAGGTILFFRRNPEKQQADSASRRRSGRSQKDIVDIGTAHPEEILHRLKRCAYRRSEGCRLHNDLFRAFSAAARSVIPGAGIRSSLIPFFLSALRTFRSRKIRKKQRKQQTERQKQSRTPRHTSRHPQNGYFRGNHLNDGMRRNQADTSVSCADSCSQIIDAHLPK